MHNTDMSRRRLLIAAAAAGITVPFLTEAPAFADDANIRRLIDGTARGEVGSAESGGTNMYPARYKLHGDIIRPAEWCGIFTYYCWSIGGATKKPAMRKAVDTSTGHWATYWQKWGKDNGRWNAKKANIGDVVVYGNWGVSGHVGIVVDVKKNSAGEATSLKTVEGNISNKVVAYGWRSPGSMYGNGQKLSGYVRPVA